MRPSQAHFVTSCQQLLVLGTVLAVLTPAASVISLDVVTTPGSTRAGVAPAPQPVPDQPTGDGGRADPGQRREPTVRVPAAPVEPIVREVALTREDGSTEPDDAPEQAEELTRTTVLSDPQRVTGYGAVGVTWSHRDQVEHDRIRLEVRTATDGDWSGWTPLEYHDEHAPDPTSEEARSTRPGTDPLFVGEVDRVQLRATAADGLPDDMSLAVVAPGRPSATTREPAGAPAEQGPAEAAAGGGGDAIALQAATSSAPRPTIFTRAQWGANERLRDGRPSYGSISAGFVHHTVNSNSYSRADVPGMIRSIYAYHTQSRGWSDIGYNFLVDRFGRIWEGRYGGVARPVIGAHTLGYNDDSFAMSAIGNYETARPSDRLVQAYGRLFAWKLGLAGVDPMDRSQNVNGDTFAAISGHRDAGSTACPGRHLYAQIPAIRTYAQEAGESGPVTLRQVDSDLAATPHPDLVVRRASDSRGMVLPTGGFLRLLGPTTVAGSGWAGRTVLASPDLTGDGRIDVVTLDRRGSLEIRPGPASRDYRRVVQVVGAFRGHALVTPTGDLNGDGRADLVARDNGRLVSFLRTERGGFRRVPQPTSLRGYQQLVAAGDVTSDGRPDLWGRDHRGRVWLNAGLNRGRFATRTLVAGDFSGVDWLVGGVDHTSDGEADLVVRRTNGDLVVLPGRGDGTLGRATGPVGNASGLTSITSAGQIAGHGAPDLLAVGARGALVAVLNRGTFDLGRPIDTGQSFGRGNLLLNAGDFDGDGDGDVVLRRRIGSLWLYRGTGTGRLAAPQWIAGKRPFRNVSGIRVVADVTGDRRHDVVGTIGEETFAWPGNGAGRLGTRQAIDVAPDAARSLLDLAPYDWTVSTSDLSGRGRSDLVVRDGDGYVFRLNGWRKGYRAPRYLGEAGGYDLAG